MGKEIEFKIYVPGGNDTALVYGKNFTAEARKRINDKIMNEYSNIEQVGFLNIQGEPELIMAGGEFCANATRSAAYYYLDGKDGSINIKVNNKNYIEAGVKNGNSWCQIPIDLNKKIIETIDIGKYKVNMNGMTMIVLTEAVSNNYLKVEMLDKEEKLKKVSIDIIKKYDLLREDAVGVMFLENIEGILKINPVVWVRSIDTLFYETACGSGTTATAIVKSLLSKEDFSLNVLQPSGYVIKASIYYHNNSINKAIVSGKVLTDNLKRKIILRD